MPKIYLYLLSFTISLSINLILSNTTYAQVISPIGNINTSETKTVTVSGLSPNTSYFWKESILEVGTVTPKYTEVNSDCFTSSATGNIDHTIGPFSVVGSYRLEVSQSSANSCSTALACSVTACRAKQDFSVGIAPTSETGTCQISMIRGHLMVDKDECKNGNVPTQEGATISGYKCVCRPPGTPGQLPQSAYTPLNSTGIGCNAGTTDCTSASGISCGDDGVVTAIGCIHTKPEAFIKDIFKFVLGIGGGIAFLMMVFGAFQMITSSGNPDTLKSGHDRFINAVIGLLFIVFSVLFLQIIGVDILQIPGFKK